MLIYGEMKKCFRSLLIHRLRTILSSLGILFGVAAVVAMLSIGEGAKQEIVEQIEQLGANSIFIKQLPLSQMPQAMGHTTKGLSMADVSALEFNIPEILSVIPLKAIEASCAGSKIASSPAIVATTRHYADMKGLELTEGRFLCDLDQNEKRCVCVLGDEVAQELGTEGHLGQSLRLDQSHFEIVGILKATNVKSNKRQVMTMRNLDRSIFIPLGSNSLIKQRSEDCLTEIVVQIKEIKKVKITACLIKKILAKLHGEYEDYQIIIPQEILQQAYRAQQTFNWVLGSIATISLLVGGIGIMNIMLATVSERTSEIGIRRAVGANKKHILIQFLSETLLLTFGGAILGIILGVCLSKLISLIAGWHTIVTCWSIMVAMLMSSVVGVCSGLYPAYKAATSDAIKALRHV